MSFAGGAPHALAKASQANPYCQARLRMMLSKIRYRFGTSYEPDYNALWSVRGEGGDLLEGRKVKKGHDGGFGD